MLCETTAQLTGMTAFALFSAGSILACAYLAFYALSSCKNCYVKLSSMNFCHRNLKCLVGRQKSAKKAVQSYLYARIESFEIGLNAIPNKRIDRTVHAVPQQSAVVGAIIDYLQV
jgi:hypothetical protein